MRELSSPWLTLAKAATYSKRGKRFLTGEVHAGRLRAARVGGRGELVFLSKWLDEWLESLAAPARVMRQRA